MTSTSTPTTTLNVRDITSSTTESNVESIETTNNVEDIQQTLENSVVNNDTLESTQLEVRTTYSSDEYFSGTLFLNTLDSSDNQNSGGNGINIFVFLLFMNVLMTIYLL